MGRGLVWGGVLGVSLGGFFDGILLHQILQWHHLLSLVPGVDGLRGQVLWDGLFHVLHYALALAGLWGLWRAHRAGRLAGGAALGGALLGGFASWHALDAVLSHWLLGIHRIRVDAANPLAWDLGWLALFGVLPALAGVALLRRGGQGGGAGGAALAALGVLALGGGAWAWQGPDGPFTAVVLRPGATAAEVAAGLAAADARLVGGDVGRGVLVVEAASPWRFYGHGALLVTAGMPAGCLAWSRA